MSGGEPEQFKGVLGLCAPARLTANHHDFAYAHGFDQRCIVCRRAAPGGVGFGEQGEFFLFVDGYRDLTIGFERVAGLEADFVHSLLPGPGTVRHEHDDIAAFFIFSFAFGCRRPDGARGFAACGEGVGLPGVECSQAGFHCALRRGCHHRQCGE